MRDMVQRELGIKVECKGEVRGCYHCKDVSGKQGYCSNCGRRLIKKVGEACGEPLAYVEKNYVWTGAIRIKCKCCKSITTI